MNNLLGVILWSSYLVIGPAEGADRESLVQPPIEARLSPVVNASWFTTLGVRPVADPESGEEVLVSTGSARLPGALSRSSALRIAVARARMDAIRRCVESTLSPGQASGRIVIEGRNGIRVLDHRYDPADENRLFVTIAVSREWIDRLQIREQPATRAQTKPPAPTKLAATRQKTHGGKKISSLIRFIGVASRTIRDAMNEDPVSLVDKAREYLATNDLDLAQDYALRAHRIGARQAMVQEIHDEIELRRKLEANPASEEALIRMAAWARGHHRLHAVVEPLRASLAMLRESAGADAFVNPEAFYWVGRACEAASQADSAIEFYSKAVLYGVARDFRSDASQRMGDLQNRSRAAQGNVR